MNETIRAVVGQQPTPGFSIPVSGAYPFKAVIPGGIGQVAEAQIKIDADHDFVLFSLSGNWTPSPDFDIQVIYPDRRPMQIQPAYGPLVLGSGIFPAEVDPGFLCRSGSTIKIRFINRGAAAITVDGLLGGKFYRAMAA